MSSKFDMNLINYVSKYKPPKKELDLEDKHILLPIYNIRQTEESKNYKDKNRISTNTNHKDHKKKKVVSVTKTNNTQSNINHHHQRKSSAGVFFYHDDSIEENNNITNVNVINNENEKKKKKSSSKEKQNKKKNKEKINHLYNTVKNQNYLLKHELSKREEAINKYKKKYKDQNNIIKNLELILSEIVNNKKSSNRIENKELMNSISNIQNSIVNNFKDDIFYDEGFQEQMAIEAVDQHIIDELCPNPDLMTYEELLELEDNVGKVNKGLTNQQIDNLPNIKYSKGKNNESKQCIICMEEFKEREKVKLLPCAHIFHNNCIKQWLLKEKNCPFCKSEIG